MNRPPANHFDYLRGRSVEDQEIHNLPVGGSIPSPATHPHSANRQPQTENAAMSSASGHATRVEAVYLASAVNAGQSFALGKGAGVTTRGRSVRRFFMFTGARNRRTHRLALMLARQHPEWRLKDPALGADALDLALLLAALVALEILALTCF